MSQKIERLWQSLPTMTQSTVAFLLSYVLVVNIYIYDNFLNKFTPIVWDGMARFEFGKMIPPEIVEKYGNAPVAIFWIICSLIIFSLYSVTSSVWETIKKIVPLEISEIRGSSNHDEHYVLKRLLVRSGLVLFYIIPFVLAIYLVRPLGITTMNFMSSYIQVADPLFRQLMLFIPSAVVWLVFFWLLLFIHGIFAYEENEVELEREHDATHDIDYIKDMD